MHQVNCGCVVVKTSLKGLKLLALNHTICLTLALYSARHSQAVLTCQISVAVCKGFDMAYFAIEDDDGGARMASSDSLYTWQHTSYYMQA